MRVARIPGEGEAFYPILIRLLNGLLPPLR